MTFTDSVSTAATEPLLGAFALTIAATSIPYTLLLLARVLTPGITEIRGPRPVVTLLMLVVVVVFDRSARHRCSLVHRVSCHEPPSRLSIRHVTQT